MYPSCPHPVTFVYGTPYSPYDPYNSAMIQWNMQQQILSHAVQQQYVPQPQRPPKVFSRPRAPLQIVEQSRVPVFPAKLDSSAIIQHDIEPVRCLEATMQSMITIIPLIHVDELQKQIGRLEQELQKLQQELTQCKMQESIHLRELETLKELTKDKELRAKELQQLQQDIARCKSVESTHLRELETLSQQVQEYKVAEISHQQTCQAYKDQIKYLKKNQKENGQTIRTWKEQVEKLESSLQRLKDSELKATTESIHCKAQWEKVTMELKVLDENAHMLNGLQNSHDRNFAEVKILGDSAIDPSEKDELQHATMEDMRIKLFNFMVYRPIGLKYIRDIQAIHETEREESSDAIQRLVEHIHSIPSALAEPSEAETQVEPESNQLDKKGQQIRILQSVIRTLRMEMERKQTDFDILKRLNATLMIQVQRRKTNLFDFIHHYIKIIYWQQAQLFIIIFKYFNYQHKSCDEEFQRIFKNSKSDIWKKFHNDLEAQDTIFG